MSLLVELKRRNVFRMAGLYLIGMWFITQLAGTALPMFEVPTGDRLIEKNGAP
jgi:adenylate cyclase